MLAAAFWHNPMSSILFGTIVPWVCGHMHASKKLVLMALFFFFKSSGVGLYLGQL